jgi:ADP-heptose:LPS heptosyltransferase
LLDTAALIEQLDLVIAVDTAIVHLAGALGRPTWVLNRFESEWRWMLGREDCAWYPTVRIFSQREPGAWDDVIRRVADALALAAHRGRA